MQKNKHLSVFYEEKDALILPLCFLIKLFVGCLYMHMMTPARCFGNFQMVLNIYFDLYFGHSCASCQDHGYYYI